MTSIVVLLSLTNPDWTVFGWVVRSQRWILRPRPIEISSGCTDAFSTVATAVVLPTVFVIIIKITLMSVSALASFVVVRQVAVIIVTAMDYIGVMACTAALLVAFVLNPLLFAVVSTGDFLKPAVGDLVGTIHKTKECTF